MNDQSRGLLKITSVALFLIASFHGGKTTFGQQSCPDGKFLARYYENESFKGQPFSVKCEETINNYWRDGGPGKVEGGGDGKSDSVTRIVTVADHFSVVWNGIFAFEEGDYIFSARADDGIRIWVDNILIINEWRVQGSSDFQQEIHLTPGRHRIIVRYFEHEGDATAHVSWLKKPDQ